MQPIERSITFTGPFADACARFVAEKHALGYRYRREALLLRAFDQFSQAAEATPSVLSKDLVVAWIEKRPHERPRTQGARIYVIRQFALFLARQGSEAYILPARMYPKPVQTFTPYIFTREELARLFQAADALPPRTVAPARHRVLPLLLRLLYGCGLRISEALGLRVRDVNLDDGVLTILGAKCGKDRLVPMAPSLTQRCRAYAREVLGAASADAPFFPAPDHGPYSVRTIYMNYRALLWQCRISHGGRGHGPRLHDFRHTAAVHCLQRWVQEGKDLTAALPVLSTYLGHASLDGTQQYLRLTAELYPDITKAVDTHFGQVIPDGRSV